jgi:hypothetical protein
LRDRHLIRLLVIVLLVVLAGGCQVRTEVAVDVAEDGSGTVSVAAALDPDATSRYPGLESELRLGDLTAAGWEVVGPRVEDDGYTWIRASKPFGTPEEAAEVLAEIAGTDGALRDLSLVEERSFARTTYRFEGTADLTGGLESFADPELAAALGGLPLGESVADIEARIGSPIDEAFTLQVSVALPGETPVVWEPRFADDEPLAMLADAEVVRGRTLGFLAVAVVAGLVAVLVGVVSPVRRWRRRRSVRPRGRHGTDPRWRVES